MSTMLIFQIQKRKLLRNILNKMFYIFDLQFKSEIFLNKILQDFRTFIEEQDFLLDEGVKILYSHPKKGLFKW